LSHSSHHPDTGDSKNAAPVEPIFFVKPPCPTDHNHVNNQANKQLKNKKARLARENTMPSKTKGNAKSLKGSETYLDKKCPRQEGRGKESFCSPI
jgi:hypothetical protein